MPRVGQARIFLAEEPCSARALPPYQQRQMMRKGPTPNCRFGPRPTVVDRWYHNSAEFDWFARSWNVSEGCTVHMVPSDVEKTGVRKRGTERVIFRYVRKSTTSNLNEEKLRVCHNTWTLLARLRAYHLLPSYHSI